MGEAKGEGTVSRPRAQCLQRLVCEREQASLEPLGKMKVVVRDRAGNEGRVQIMAGLGGHIKES